MAMHHDEIRIDEDLVRELIAAQFPQWAHAPVRRLETDGTVNVIFRVGSDLAARLPLRPAGPNEAAAAQAREAAAMAALAAHCPFPTPTRVAAGAPGHGYPLPWSVQTWIPGTVATPDRTASSVELALDLVSLIRALRNADTHGRQFTGEGRGGDLRDSDEWMETCFQKSEAFLPVPRLRELWNGFRLLRRAGRDVMTHGDLIPGNLLVDGERIVGVLDAGGFGPADPALDLIAAWHLLDDDRRALVRQEIGCDDLEWQRGAAWAFQQSMGIVWYYRDSNPGMAELGRSTLSRIDSASPPE